MEYVSTRETLWRSIGSIGIRSWTSWCGLFGIIDGWCSLGGNGMELLSANNTSLITLHIKLLLGGSIESIQCLHGSFVSNESKRSCDEETTRHINIPDGVYRDRVIYRHDREISEIDSEFHKGCCSALEVMGCESNSTHL